METFDIQLFFKPDTRPVDGLGQFTSLLVDQYAQYMAPRRGHAGLWSSDRKDPARVAGLRVRRITPGIRKSGAGELLQILWYEPGNRPALLDQGPFGTKRQAQQRLADWSLEDRISDLVHPLGGLIGADPEEIMEALVESQKLNQPKARNVLGVCALLARAYGRSGWQNQLREFHAWLSLAMREQVWADGRQTGKPSTRRIPKQAPRIVAGALLWAVAEGGGSPDYRDGFPTDEQARALSYYPVCLWRRGEKALRAISFGPRPHEKVRVSRSRLALLTVVVQELFRLSMTHGPVSNREEKLVFERTFNGGPARPEELRALAQADWSFLAEETGEKR